MARIRRILAVPALSPHAIEPFKNGGIHPAYAYPYWHMLQALVSKLSGIDPILIWYYINALLAFVSVLAIYMFVRLLFDNRLLAAFTCLLIFLPQIFAGGNFYGMSNNLISRRLIAHPNEFSLYLMAPLLLGLFIAFIKAEKFNTALLILLGFLGLDQAFIHLPNIFYIFIYLSGFLIIMAVLKRYERRYLIKIGAVLFVFAVVGVIFYLGVASEAGKLTSSSGADATYYLNKGKLYIVGKGLLLPSPKNLISLLIPFLLAVFLIPLAKKSLGFLFIIANIITILFILTIPWVFMLMAKFITYTMANRFLGSGLQWILLPLLLFLLITYLSKRAEEFWEHGKQIQAAVIAVVPLFFYFILWPYITKIMSSFNNSITLVFAIVILLSVLGLMLLISFNKISFNTNLLEDLLTGKPRLILFIIFFIMYAAFSISTSGFNNLSTAIAETKSLPTDPIIIQGNNFEVSWSLIGAIKNNVGKDQVILSDPGTSEVITAFVPRFVVTYPSGHQAPTEVGGDSAERMRAAIDLFVPNKSIAQRRAIISRFDINYIVVNRNTLYKYKMQSENLLPGLKVLSDDGNFVLYKVENGRQ